jgi:hypothetical protein
VRASDVCRLSVLVAASQQNYYRLPSNGEIDAIAGSHIDTQFGNLASDMPYIAKPSSGEAFNSTGDCYAGLEILHASVPLDEQCGLLHEIRHLQCIQSDTILQALRRAVQLSQP